MDPVLLWICFCVKKLFSLCGIKLSSNTRTWLWNNHKGIQCVGRQEPTSRDLLCNDIREVLWMWSPNTFIKNIHVHPGKGFMAFGAAAASSISHSAHNITHDKNRDIKSKHQIVSGINLSYSYMSGFKDFIRPCLLISWTEIMELLFQDSWKVFIKWYLDGKVLLCSCFFGYKRLCQTIRESDS